MGGFTKRRGVRLTLYKIIIVKILSVLSRRPSRDRGPHNFKGNVLDPIDDLLFVFLLLNSLHDPVQPFVLRVILVVLLDFDLVVVHFDGLVSVCF